MASLISWLKYSGARKVDGTPVASGRAYFYQPGTSTPVTVYSDADGLVAITQPKTLDAAGRAEVYAKVQCRVEVQEAVTFTQIANSDRANTINATQVEIENINVLGTNLSGPGTVMGGRTDLDTQLTSWITGAGGTTLGQYKESSTATSRTLQTGVGQFGISFMDFGAMGDDATDDTTAIQNAINRALAANKEIHIEPGIYRVNALLSIQGASAKGLVIRGANRADCVIKNMSTTNDAFYIDLQSVTESHVLFENFSIVANTVSSGTAIGIANGDGPVFRGMYIEDHRVGIDTSAVSYAEHDRCIVASTDGNAAGKGLRMGAFGHAVDCRVGMTNGKGFSIEGSLGRVIACRAAVTTGIGYELSGTKCYVSQSSAAGCTTGFSHLASDTIASHCQVATCGTSFSIGAVARAGCVTCLATDGSTSDFATNASATLVVDGGNTFTTRTPSEYGGSTWLGQRQLVLTKHRQTSTQSGGTLTITPDPSKGTLQVWVKTGGTSITTITIGPTATAGLANGQVMILALDNQSGANATGNVFTWDAQYAVTTTNTYGQAPGIDVATTNLCLTVVFVWNSTTSKWVELLTTHFHTNTGAAFW